MLYTNITNFNVFCWSIIIFLIIQYKHNECVMLFYWDKSFSEFFKLVTNYLGKKKKKKNDWNEYNNWESHKQPKALAQAIRNKIRAFTFGLQVENK